METGYKVFRKDIWKVKLRENRFGIEPEITAKLAVFQILEFMKWESPTLAEPMKKEKIGMKDAFVHFTPSLNIQFLSDCREVI